MADDTDTRLVPSTNNPDIIFGRDLTTSSPITATIEALCSGTYVLGVQGVGKSSLLEQIACQLLQLDESLVVFDPHGQLIDNIIKRMPERRLEDTFHLNLKDRKNPFALNVFACADPNDEEERDRTHNRVMQAFQKLWPETRSGVYFQKLLPQIVTLLIEHPQLTLADVPRLLRDGLFRERYTRTVRNEGNRLFWEFDYDELPPSQQRTQTQPLLNRIQELLADPVITRIICQPQSSIDLTTLITQRKNVFVRLPINEEAYTRSARLVGIMLMSLVYSTTFSFADLPEHQRPGFSLIVDEFQNFATEDYAKLFSQGRKFKVKQFLAHQYRGQLNDAAADANKDATLSAFTKIVFRVTEPDSRALGSLFLDLQERLQPTNIALDVIDKLEKHQSEIIKDFVATYIWPLQAAAKARANKRKQFYYQRTQGCWWLPQDPLSGNEPEMEHSRWAEYVLKHNHGIIAGALSNKEERYLHDRVMNPIEGVDFLWVPEYVEQDFGVGPVQVNPKRAEQALQLLNILFYDVQRTSFPICHAIMNARDQIPADLFDQYQTNVNRTNRLDDFMGPLLGYGEWIAKQDEFLRKGDMEGHRRFVDSVVDKGEPLELRTQYLFNRLWQQAVRNVVNELIRSPITQGPSGVRPIDVSTSLQQLPLRQAYVRIGTEPHVMQTEPLTAGVEAKEEERRRLQLQEQTRQTLCRHVATERRMHEETPATPTLEPVQQDEEAVTAAPLLRRSRPLE